MRPACALAVALVLLCAPSGARQEKSLWQQMLEAKAPSELRQYYVMVEAYEHGDEAASVDALLEWTHERIANALKLANGSQDPLAPWARRLYALAVMLHTDAALKIAPGAETNDAFWHLDVAGQLLAMGTRRTPEEIRPLAEQWYLALSRVLRDRLAPYVAELLLEGARERLPDNPIVLGESGTLAELFATDYALIGNPATHSVEHGREVRLEAILARRTGHLNAAARWLRQAAGLDPGNELTAVHLGRVLALRREDEQAVGVLDRVVITAKNDEAAYLAALFLGGLRERQGRLDQAENAYRAAIARFPSGHAAYVGLSEVLQRTARGDASRDALLIPLTEKPGPTREPLWWYQFDPPGVAERRLDAIRKDVRQ